MNWMNILLMIFLVTTFLVGNSMYERDLVLKDFQGVEHVTSKLDWNLTYDLLEPSSKDDIISSRIHNIVYKFADFLGYSAFEVTKTGIEFGYENPQYNYEFAFTLLKWLIIIMILSALVPLFIPVVALITIIGMGINNLFKKLRKRKDGK
ncbi:hypothetical protein LCGC14_1254800 [marine sediment metagenome]|uniref:Uncharacterized protein n=1 Tax=marine sediment metagenome TaxID=412755 RepID=A0A0F9L2F6_9ZZZZ